MSIKNFDPNRIKEYDLETLKTFKKFLDDEYYNTGSSSLSDEKYDKLLEYLEKIDPENQEEDEILEVVGGRNKKVKLPLYMGSQKKFKPENEKEIDRWSKKFLGPYVITPKLDGLACLVEYKNGEINLYTKGKSKTGYGSDISFIGSTVKNIPHDIPRDINIRGELIVSTNIYDKYSSEYDNARQMVAGLISSQRSFFDNKEISKQIEFVAYEVISPDNHYHKLVDQLTILTEYGFKTPDHVYTDEIDVGFLTSTLLDMKKYCPYYIDGIVCTSNNMYIREIEGNPPYSFAFKMVGLVVEAIVVEILWKVQKTGKIKPRVKIIPVQVSGVMIEKATAHNAKYIKNNKIGKGSKIKIIRSGDVIPYIAGVISSGEPDMPTIPYIWNDSEVDIIATDSQREICLAVLVNFFKVVGVEFFGPKTVEKFYNYGFTSLESILDTKASEFQKVDRMAKKSAEKLYENIHASLQNIKLSKLLSASGTLGNNIGEKNIITLFKQYPNILSETNLEKIRSKIMSIEGFSDKKANVITDNIKVAKIFLIKIKKYATLYKAPIILDNFEKVFKGMKIVFSGFRDVKLTENIEKLGGKVTNSVSKNTNILIVKDIGEESGKILKARGLGVKILEIVSFKKLFENKNE